MRTKVYEALIALGIFVCAFAVSVLHDRAVERRVRAEIAQDTITRVIAHTDTVFRRDTLRLRATEVRYTTLRDTMHTTDTVALTLADTIIKQCDSALAVGNRRVEQRDSLLAVLRSRTQPRVALYGELLSTPRGFSPVIRAGVDVRMVAGLSLVLEGEAGQAGAVRLGLRKSF